MKTSRKARHLAISLLLLSVSALSGTGGCGGSTGPNCKGGGARCEHDAECCLSNCVFSDGERRCGGLT